MVRISVVYGWKVILDPEQYKLLEEHKELVIEPIKKEGDEAENFIVGILVAETYDLGEVDDLDMNMIDWLNWSSKIRNALEDIEVNVKSNARLLLTSSAIC